MYQEYLDNYTEYSKKFGSKVAIFLMVGIFYEMYDVVNPETGESKTTFNELVDLLGLKVSHKKGEGPDGLDGIVAGIPDYTVHKWAGKLTQLGWTVILIEQVKNVAGKVIKREVQRILTPGSHVEAASSADLYLTFVSLVKANPSEAPYIAVTALDLTTGHLHVFETQAEGTSEAWTSNDIVQFMELYPPREVLWSVDGCISINESKLRNILGCQSGTTFHQRAPLNSGAWLKPQFKEEYLRKQCGLKSLLPTHVALYISPGSRTELALLSLLYALEELWPSMNLGSLLVFPWIPGSTMRLGENALVQLHMITQTQDSKLDVLSIFSKCSTPMGHRGIRERLLKPSADALHIMKGLEAVDSWMKKPGDYKSNVQRRLKTMSDVHRLYRRIQQGSITASDLMSLDTTLKATEWIMKEEKEPILSETVSLKKDLYKIFDIQKIYGASEDKSLFVKGLVPGLDLLESQIQTQLDRIEQWISCCAKYISVSPDIFKPEFREKSLVIKGPRGAIQTLKASSKLPQGVTGVTNKTVSYLESSELDQIFLILCKLRESLKKQQSIALVEQGSILANTLLVPWMMIADWLTQTDVNLTLARIASENGYVKPTIQEGSEGLFTIEGLRHPLLEAQDRKIPYVQHDIGLGIDGSQGWLLYGLNASGKSSLMRATGLAVLLAQAGSFVPASKMSISPFTSLHTRIINTDNLWMGLSSFAVEMSEMRDIFRDAGSRSLVLGDELCSGTETTSATALVAAGLRGLLKRGARFLFATHLHGLSEIQEVTEDPNLKIKHLHVEYDRLKDRLVYHRTLRSGSGSALYGLEVAKAMRIPDDIMEDAIRFRKRLTGETDLHLSVGSSWNSEIIRRKCERCNKTELESLEVHHIRERQTANAVGRLVDGSSVHSAANLVVLCDMCHDLIHSGQVSVNNFIQTSDGPERSVSETIQNETKIYKSKWTDEQEEIIKSVCQKFPALSMQNISKYLLNQHDIKISAVTLKKFKN